jgi:hypothetical protein
MGGDYKLKQAALYCFTRVCEYVTPKSTEACILHIDSASNLNLHFISTVTLLFLLFDATEQKLIGNEHRNTSAIMALQQFVQKILRHH